MRKKLWIYLALLIVIPGLLFATGCARQVTEVEEEPETPVAVEKKEEVAEEKPTEVVAEQPEQPEDTSAITASRNMFLTEHVHFAFDKYNLDDEAQSVLKRKAEFLQDNPEIYVTIEGHCDERGTNEYNLALGDRRAESTKSFLLDLGIEAYRLSTVSYGEERPLCDERDEECWARNRRSAFLIN